jgi:anti-sigma regulatory factor (Ser/Thr protein kinase)
VPSLTLLRDRIDAALPEVDAQIVGDVQMVATELVTNAYLHGRPPIRFELLAPAAGPELRVEVTDTGSGDPHVEHPDVDTFHGRGLLLVGKLTAAWGVNRTPAGKTVWAAFSVSRPDAVDEQSAIA